MYGYHLDIPIISLMLIFILVGMKDQFFEGGAITNFKKSYHLIWQKNFVIQLKFGPEF